MNNTNFLYKINVLEELKKVGYSTTVIRNLRILPESTLQKFRNGDTNISLNTLAKICELLKKNPWEIMYFATSEVTNTEEQKQEQEQERHEKANRTEKGVKRKKEASVKVGRPEEPAKKEIITPEMHKEMIFEVCNKAKMFLPVLKGSEKQKKYARDLMNSAIEYTKKGAKEEIERIEGYANDNGYTEEAQELAEAVEKGCIKIVNAYVEYFKTVTTCQEIIDIKGLLPIRQPNLNRLESASKKEKMDFANHVNKEMSKAFGENWKEKYK